MYGLGWKDLVTRRSTQRAQTSLAKADYCPFHCFDLPLQCILFALTNASSLCKSTNNASYMLWPDSFFHLVLTMTQTVRTNNVPFWSTYTFLYSAFCLHLQTHLHCANPQTMPPTCYDQLFSFVCFVSFALNIFYSWQNMTKDWAEPKSYVYPSLCFIFIIGHISSFNDSQIHSNFQIYKLWN